MYLAEIERLAGNNAEALTLLLRGDATLADADEQSDRATVQAMLARVHERLGDREAARSAIALSDELGASDDVINFMITRTVRARLALSDGDTEAAERWARGAAELASRTDFIAERAEAQLELGRVLAALGRQEEASSETGVALRLCQAKGDQPRVAEARALLEEIGSRA
jgi:hypothetical protein